MILIISVVIVLAFSYNLLFANPKIDGGIDSTSYTYDKLITITYYYNGESLDSVHLVEEENNPILCGNIYRFAYKEHKLFLNMHNRYYIYSIKDDLLSEFSNEEFYSKYSDYGDYKWIHPHSNDMINKVSG